MAKSKKAKKVKPARRKSEPADWQEPHSPTVEFTARGDVRHDPVTGRPKREVLGLARRRKDDAELVMGLDLAQIQAAEELRDAYFAVVGGVAVRGASYEQRVDNQRGMPTGVVPEADRTTHHFAWAEACRAAGIDVDAVHEVICEGYGCKTVDRARGRRKGWTATQVRQGLDLWAPTRPKRPKPHSTAGREFHSSASGQFLN